MASGALRNLTVGLIFLGSLVVVGVATLTITDIPFLRKVEALTVRFPDVDNLQEGDDVVVHGLRVGQVQSIRYDPGTYPGTPIVVTCSLPENVHEHLGEGSRFTIHSAGPLGGRYIEITPPPMGAAPPPRGIHVGEAPGDFFKQISELVRKNERNINDLFEKVNPAMDKIDAAAAEVRETFRAANSGEGTLGLLLKDKATKDKVEKGVADLSEMIGTLKEDLSGEKGTIGYLLKNEKGKEDLKAAITELREIVLDVREGKGIAGRLINDAKLADQFQAIVDDLHETVHKVNTGQGTLGQVINNPKAWDELVRVLVLARETIEDLREQAPVSTFVNAAFASF